MSLRSFRSALVLLLLLPVLALAGQVLGTQECTPKTANNPNGMAKVWGEGWNASGKWGWVMCADGVTVHPLVGLWAENLTPDKIGSRLQTVFDATDTPAAIKAAHTRHVKFRWTEAKYLPVAGPMCQQMMDMTGRALDGCPQWQPGRVWRRLQP